MTKAKYDLINEQVVLAAILQDEQSRKRAFAHIGKRDFFRPRHRTIFKAIVKCEADKVAPEEVAIATRVKGEFSLAYLKKLFVVPVTQEIDRCLDNLRKDAARARVKAQVEDLVDAAQDRAVQYDDVVAEASGLLGGLTQAPLTVRGEGMDADDWIENFEEGKVVFVSTGYKALDKSLMEGYAPGSLTVVAGRPRMGKTMFMIDTLRQLIRRTDRRVLFVALEKDRNYIINLLSANLVNIDKKLILKERKSLVQKQVKKISGVVRRVFNTGRLIVIDNPIHKLLSDGKWTNLTAVDLMGQVMIQYDADIVIWDVWQRALADESPGAVSVALAAFYEYGKATNTHNIVVQQLHRRVEDRSKDKNRRPTLNDLKQSGAYEERADLVLFIHREKVFKKHVVRGDVMEIIVGKQKLGPDGMTMMAKFRPETCRLDKPRLAGAEDLMPGTGFV